MSESIKISELKNGSAELNKKYAHLRNLAPKPKAEAATAAVPPPTTGLEPYTGEWTLREAKHLANRTLFGSSYETSNYTLNQGLNLAVEELLSAYDMPSPPVNTLANANVEIGETWVDAHITIIDQVTTRAISLGAWNTGLMLNQEFSIREKMTLFWHNHFAVQIDAVEDPRYFYKYITLVRENALGNFRELCKAVTKDPAMLRYLNGNQNFNIAPNENFARELFELYTIGKGPLAGPGDYTNYTEEDIAQAAKVLTGWIDLGFGSLTPGELIESVYIPEAHDTSTKQFSQRFNNAQIGPSGDTEYLELLDMIFQQEECAKFISRKLYRFFCHYIIDDSVEVNMIEPMASLLLANDYNIAPVLDALFKSAHFYDAEIVGCQIKNPIDSIFGLMNQFSVNSTAEDVVTQYSTWTDLAFAVPLLQMDYFNPPSVAGWEAYYQAPLYYRKWINAVTLPIRTIIPPALIFEGLALENGETLVIDSLEFINNMPEPAEVNALITDVTNFLFARPITFAQSVYLKLYLLQGLPDFEWNVEYTNYLDDPDNEDLQNSVRNKTNLFLYGCLTMPESFLA